MKPLFWAALCLSLFLPIQVFANACLSNATGNWSEAGTWTDCGGTTPQSADTVQIQNTHTVTLNADATVTSVTIDAGGTLTEDGVGRTLTISGGWTNNGTFTAASSLVRFRGAQTITGDTVFYDLSFTPNGNNTFTIASGTYATTTGTLTIDSTFQALFSGGNVDVLGDLVLSNSSASGGGTTVFSFLGSGTQTVTSTAEIGRSELPHVVINKSGGSLSLVGIVSVQGNWTYTQGTVVPGSSTVALTNGNKTITGSMTFNHLNLHTAGANTTYTFAAGTFATTTNLTLSGTGGNLNISGNIDVLGDLSLGNTATNGGGSGTIQIMGAGAQAITSTVTTNQSQLPNLVIDKPSGTLTLDGFISLDRSWTYVRGTVDATTASSTVVTANNMTIDGEGSSETMTFDNLIAANTTVTLAGDLQVARDLTINASSGLTTSDNNVTVGGNWTNAGTYTSGSNTTIFNTTATSNILGTNTFNHLTSTTAGKTIIFPADTTTTVSGTLTLQGSSGAGNTITIKSSAAGTDGQKEDDEFYLSVATAGTLEYLTIYDSIAMGDAPPLTANLSTDGGNNTNWTIIPPNTTPTVSSLGPAGLVDGSWTTDNTPTFTFTTADADADTVAYELTIDDSSDFSSPVYQATSTYAAAADPVSTTTGALPDSASYYWRVLVGDGAATSSYSVANSGNIAFKLDATAPTPGEITFSDVTQTTITATTTGFSDATSGLTATPYQYHNTTLDTYSGATSTPVIFTGLTAGTSYTYEVGVQDIAGNWATSTTYATTTLALPTYTVGGTVSGLAGTLVLQNNAADDEALTENGAFTFNTALTDEATYEVTVLSQPTGQTCTVINGSGTLAGANVTTVAIVCADDESPDPEPTPDSSSTITSGGRSGRSRVGDVPSPILSLFSPAPLPWLTYQAPPLVERGADFVRGLLGEEPEAPIEVVLPPLEEVVTDGAPLALRGEWSLLSNEPLRQFVLAPLPADFERLVTKFPGLNDLLAELDVRTEDDLFKLQTARLYLPGLTRASQLDQPALSPADWERVRAVPLAELPVELKANLPEGVVFVRSGGERVDLSPVLTVGEDGQAEQRVTTILSQPLTLAIKPVAPVNGVNGYLTLKAGISSGRSRAALPFADWVASPLFALSALSAAPTVENINQELVVAEFAYEDEDGDGIYTAEIEPPKVAGEYEVVTVLDYQDEKLGRRLVRLITVVDPEGYIYEAVNGKELRINEATVTLWQKTGDAWVVWPAPTYSQENPQITDLSGHYSFLVPPGTYRLSVAAPGYHPFEGEEFLVQLGRGVHQNIELTPRLSWRSLLDWRSVLLVLTLAALLYLVLKRKIKNKLT